MGKEKITGNALENYLRQKEPLTAKEISKKSGVSESKISLSRKNTKTSIVALLEVAYGLKDTKVSIKGIENGKEVSLNLEIKY